MNYCRVPGTILSTLCIFKPALIVCYCTILWERSIISISYSSKQRLSKDRDLPRFSALVRGKSEPEAQVFKTHTLGCWSLRSTAFPGQLSGDLDCLNRPGEYLNKPSILHFELLPLNYCISLLFHPGNGYFICLPGGPLKWRSTQLRKQISIFTFGKQPDIASSIRRCLLLSTVKRKRKKKESTL